MRKRLLFFSIVLLQGCATIAASRHTARIKGVDWPLGELRSLAASMLPVGPRGQSGNGREIVSKHFVLEGKRDYKPSGDATERYFATVFILGDRRPYNLEILVTSEKRVLKGNQFTYVIDGYDTRLAKELEQRLQAELTKRREDLNIIDDFRVF